MVYITHTDVFKPNWQLGRKQLVVWMFQKCVVSIISLHSCFEPSWSRIVNCKHIWYLWSHVGLPLMGSAALANENEQAGKQADTGTVNKKQNKTKKHQWQEKNKPVSWAMRNIQIEQQLVVGNNTSACIMWHASDTIIRLIRNRFGLHIGFITDVMLYRVKSISVRSRVCVTAALERQVCAHVFWMNHPVCLFGRLKSLKIGWNCP